MKTKTEIFVLVEIAIVLCSVFLVALPTIAAGQTMQEVSTSTITTASEDDYVLGVYGNANEDDTIDMRDLTYVKLIFFGKKPETELADAKYDGKINPLDFIQIKLIIVGKEKELTVVDSVDRIVTVKKPVERIVVPSKYALQTIRSLKLDKDKIVGIDDSTAEEDEYFPEFSGLSSVGGWTLDYEAILSLHPDLMISWHKAEEHAEKLPGIPIVGLYCYRPDTYVDEVRKLGYILDKKDEADEFLEFHNGALDPVKEEVEGIPEEDKPKVYLEWHGPYKTCGEGSGFHEKIRIAGGNNIFSDLSGYPEVTAEDVIFRDPEIIVIRGYVMGRYNTGGDISKLVDIRNEVMNRPELAEVTAVKNGKVYILFGDVLGGTRHFIGIQYLAKWFHPKLFADLDPKAIHQEYLTRFQGLDYDLDKHGVFVYPPLSS